MRIFLNFIFAIIAGVMCGKKVPYVPRGTKRMGESPEIHLYHKSFLVEIYVKIVRFLCEIVFRFSCEFFGEENTSPMKTLHSACSYLHCYVEGELQV